MAGHSWALLLFKWGPQIPLIHVPEGLRAVPITICGVLICLFSVGHQVAMATGTKTDAELTE